MSSNYDIDIYMCNGWQTCAKRRDDKLVNITQSYIQTPGFSEMHKIVIMDIHNKYDCLNSQFFSSGRLIGPSTDLVEYSLLDIKIIDNIYIYTIIQSNGKPKQVTILTYRKNYNPHNDITPINNSLNENKLKELFSNTLGIKLSLGKIHMSFDILKKLQNGEYSFGK